MEAAGLWHGRKLAHYLNGLEARLYGPAVQFLVRGFKMGTLNGEPLGEFGLLVPSASELRFQSGFGWSAGYRAPVDEILGIERGQ